MQAYRLEMGTHFENKQGKDLYEFWGGKLTEQINKDLKAVKSKTLINLASNEYFKSLQADDIDAEIIVPVFKDFKNGKYKMIMPYVKKARGLMARYIVEKNISDLEAIKSFDYEGYKFSYAQSDDKILVFVRG